MPCQHLFKIFLLSCSTHYEPSAKHGFSLLGKFNCSIWLFLLCFYSWESSCPHRIFILCCTGGNTSYFPLLHIVSQKRREDLMSKTCHFTLSDKSKKLQGKLFNTSYSGSSQPLCAARTAAAGKTRTICLLGCFCVLFWGFYGWWGFCFVFF